MSRVLAVTTAVIGLAVAGCGGDDSGETTTPTVSIPAVTSPIPGTEPAGLRVVPWRAYFFLGGGAGFWTGSATTVAE